MWFEYLLSFFSIYVVVAIVAATHALLYVRDSRAAFGWLGLIVVFPIAGALLYALFGINRVRRKAQRISQDTDSEPLTDPVTHQVTDGVLRNRPGYNITGQRVVPGNSVARAATFSTTMAPAGCSWKSWLPRAIAAAPFRY
jgi:cardiolipin synthase